VSDDRNSRDEWDAMAEVTRRPLPAERDEATALRAEVERLRDTVAFLRACVPPTHPTDYGHEVWTETVRAEVTAERAAVVRWLHGQLCVPGLSPDEKRLLGWASRRIERGEHRREGGE
jgi:hypothetical protein